MIEALWSLCALMGSLPQLFLVLPRQEVRESLPQLRRLEEVDANATLDLVLDAPGVAVQAELVLIGVLPPGLGPPGHAARDPAIERRAKLVPPPGRIELGTRPGQPDRAASVRDAERLADSLEIPGEPRVVRIRAGVLALPVALTHGA